MQNIMIESISVIMGNPRVRYIKGKASETEHII